ncbi:MAG: hypothetical protein QXR81_08925 [Candidatus Nezhaarchaeales archaeon]
MDILSRFIGEVMIQRGAGRDVIITMRPLKKRSYERFTVIVSLDEVKEKNEKGTLGQGLMWFNVRFTGMLEERGMLK